MKSSRLTVGAKLAAGFALVLLLLIAIASIAWWRLDKVNQVLGEMMNEVLVKERLSSEWATRTNVNGARTALVAESLDPARQQEVQALIKQNSDRIGEIQKQLESFENSDEEEALFEQIAAQRKSYIAAREEVFIAKDENEERARRLVGEKLEPALNAYVDMINKMAAHHAARTKDMAAEIERAGVMSQRLTALLGVLAVALGATVAF